MKGTSELISGIKAGYSFFYAQTEEVNKTINQIEADLTKYYDANKNGIAYQTKVWDFERTNEMGESNFSNPDEIMQELEYVQEGIDQVPIGRILIAKNANWFLTDEYGNFNKGMVAWLLNRSKKFSSPEGRKVMIIVSNSDEEKAIPHPLKRVFAKVEFPLPDETEIETIYNYIVDSAKSNPKFVMPTDQEKLRIIGGAKGLTHDEIVKVFSYSIVKNAGVFDPVTVEDLRSEEINSTPGLSIRKYDNKLEDLKGYDVAKEIVDEWIDDPDAKGILLLGPAGVGKTHFCQSLASYYGRMIIEMEFAQLMGDGLVGQAEKAMKRALDVVSANANPKAPIILFIDEIEKGLAGTSGAGGQGGARDGGTTDRSNAQFLKFLSDARPKGIYLVASCNDIEKLPAAYVRAERWDTAPIFVDLPNREEQSAILAHYQKVYGLKASDLPSNMVGWTGAEIKAWCKLASKKISKGKKVSEADELIVPVSKTMSAEIDYLRKWKDGRTVPASRKAMVANTNTNTRKLEM
jgi:SpoVK/Ycf46/Vps4 family AAA+-type ATPase